jgi:hypothetical protein
MTTPITTGFPHQAHQRDTAKGGAPTACGALLHQLIESPPQPSSECCVAVEILQEAAELERCLAQSLRKVRVESEQRRRSRDTLGLGQFGHRRQGAAEFMLQGVEIPDQRLDLAHRLSEMQAEMLK